ncbi:coiled-coil and C2 domain-containing protein 2A isoform X2 [Alligator sinensis]|uniref:Coiled-coil and C2 domain-containing protein 2A isoform X2 n=1 Tax=Alligator sinensis TaxID=38654 RepID=A0A3Q0FRT1_ALLSI|nr:coiled-coil and C2 domain-containing protein 2A isoform X2 [Alligator sinensis]
MHRRVSPRTRQERGAGAEAEAEADAEAEAGRLQAALEARRRRRKKPLTEPARLVAPPEAEAEAAEAGTAGMAAGRPSRSLPPVPSSSRTSFAEFSIRERMREKLKAARSKAESALLQEVPSLPPRRIKSLRERESETVLHEESYKDEPREIQEDKPQIPSRLKFHDSVKKLKQKTHGYSFYSHNTTDVFEIFTKNIKNETKSKKERDSNQEEEVEEQVSEISHQEEQDDDEMDEEDHLVKEDELFLIEQTVSDFLVVKPAGYESYSERLKKERDNLFIPSMRTVPTSQKVPTNMQPRYLEDEGLYTGERPTVSFFNQNILENRIIRQEQGKAWFGDDGNILALPNPIKPSPTRPPIFSLEEGIKPELETVYRKAIKLMPANQYIVGSGDPHGQFQMDIDISGLIFTHHPCFSREHVLAAKLAQLYDQYLARKQRNLAQLLTDKLHALRNAVGCNVDISRTNIPNPVAHQSITDYKFETRQTRRLRDAEQEKDRMLLKTIIKVWKEIKSLRDFQKFTNTPMKLYLRKEEVDRRSDEKAFEEEIQAEINELLEEYIEEYGKKMEEYKAELQEWKSWRKAKVMETAQIF